MNELVNGTITLHRALTMLKTLDKRIDSRMNDCRFIAATSGFISNGISPEEVEESESIKSRYKSIVDLVDFRRKVKSAISLANATTLVTVAGKEMMIAEVLEMKSSIAYKEKILYQMRSEFQAMTNQVKSVNQRKSEELSRLLVANVNTDDFDMKGKSDEFWGINKYRLIDPLDIEKKITELSDEIEQFKEDVDVALVEKNAQTVLVIK